MTAVCGGGTSVPYTLFQEAVTVTSVGVGAFLERLGLGRAAVPVAMALAGVTFVPQQLCAVDPPADPGLTQADLLAVLNFEEAGPAAVAADKIRQWFLSQYWWVLCHCETGTTPSPPSPSDPGGVATDTGLPPGVPAPCWTAEVGDSGVFLLDNGGLPADFFHFLNQALPQTTTVTVQGPDTRLTTAPAQVLPGGTIANITARWRTTGAFNQVPWVRLLFADIAGTVLGGFSITPNAPTSDQTHVLPAPPANAHSWYLVNTFGNTGDIGASWTATLDFSYQCATGEPQPVLACCPPDPYLNAQLSQIYGLLQSISDRLALEPTHWVPGAHHGPLSGFGSFPLTGKAVALRVDMVTPPTGTTINDGSPPFYWDAGFITPFVLDSPLRGQRLVFTPETMQLPSFTDTIGYTLLHGCTVDITELLPAF